MQRILILALFLACSGSLYAQYEWAPLGATWTYNYSFRNDDFFPEPTDPVAWKYEFSATGDTTWNGMPARIVGSHIHVQDGFKVYYVWDDALHLLFDFALEVGDTAIFELLTCECEVMLVDVKVDSVFVDTIDGLPLRRIHTSPLHTFGEWNPTQYAFQEKIGRLATEVLEYLDEGGCPVAGDFTPAFLRCYTDQEVHITTKAFEWYSQGQVDCDYSNPNFPTPASTGSCHYLPVSTAEQAPAMPIARLYPNPARHSLYLELEAQASQLQFQLVHLSGIQAGLWAVPAGTRAQQLQLPELPAGIYIWTLRGEGMFQSGKLLVE